MPRGWVGMTRPLFVLARFPGGDLLGELDDEALGTAQIAEPIGVLLVVVDLADGVEALGAEPVDERGEIVDLDADMPQARPVRRPGMRAFGVGRRVVFDEFQPAGAVRR